MSRERNRIRGGSHGAGGPNGNKQNIQHGLFTRYERDT